MVGDYCSTDVLTVPGDQFCENTSLPELTKECNPISVPCTSERLANGRSSPSTMFGISTASSSKIVSCSKSSKHKIGFDPKWKTNHPWLKTEICKNSSGVNVLGMFCEICRKYKLKGGNGSSVWSLVPCTYLRADSILAHVNSPMHKEGLSLVCGRTKRVEMEPNERDLTGIVTLLKSLVLLIRQNIPHTTFFKPFVEFAIHDLKSPHLQMFGEHGNLKYTSAAIQNDMITAVAEVCRENFLKALSDSPAASLLIDETTDFAVRKHLGIAVKYLDNSGGIITQFLDSVQIKNGTAGCITETINLVCQKHSISMNKFQSIGTDGVNVMVGKKSGVVKRLQEALPTLIGIHCANHRLALACKESFEGIRFFNKLLEIIKATFTYYHYSSNKSSSLKEVQELLKEIKKENSDMVTVKSPSFTRWLSHINSVSSIRRTYAAILTDLENAIVLKLPTNSSGPTPDALLKNLKCFKTYFTLCWLNDVLAEISHLTLVLEADYLDITMFQTKLILCKTNLKLLQKKTGVLGRKVEKKGGQELGLIPSDSAILFVYNTFKELVPELISNIDERFDKQSVIFAFGALDISSITDELSYACFGEGSLILLCEHFKLDEDQVLTEWNSFKETLKGNVKKADLQMMYKFILHLEKTAGTIQFQNVKFLISVALTLPLSTAIVERIFSQVKNVVSPKRNRLDICHVSDFLSFKFSDYVDYIRAAKKFLSVV